MKRPKARIAAAMVTTALAILAHGQGQNMFQSDGLGNQYLLNPAPPAFPFPPRSVHIGTLPVGGFATLRVRGDQLPVGDAAPLQPGMLCTFRTDVASAIPQSWRMYRDINKIGAIWNEGAHRVWHVQSLEQRDVGADRYSGLMLQNEANDGIWVMNAGAPTGTRAFPVPATQVLDAVGYTAFGSRLSWLPASPRPRGPWSRLHSFHDVMGTRPEYAFRPQMLNGLTLTGNSDLAYVGQWFEHGVSGIGAEVDDASSLVIATSENTLPADTAHHQDNISFRFLSDLALTDGAASGVEGLEMMRVQPYRASAGAPIQGMVGIGNFRDGNTGPQERLDIRDRTFRLRSFVNPTTYRNDTYDRVLVANPADGRIYWRPASTLGTGAPGPCTWSLTGATLLDLATAYTNITGCPSDDNGVSIGRNPGGTFYKLGVYAKAAGSVGIYTYSHSAAALSAECFPLVGGTAPNQYTAVSGRSNNALQYNTGVAAAATIQAGNTCTQNNAAMNADAIVAGSAEESYGTRALATILPGGTSRNYAVFGAGKVEIGGSCTSNNGLYGIASGPATQNIGAYGLAYDSPTANYGVYGAAGGPQGSLNWAGYFNGNVHIIGNLTVTGTYPGSDAMLKTNVEEIPDALEIIGLLRPKRYDFLVDQFPQLALPGGQHMGLIAQDVQEVLPNIVKEFRMPAMTSQDGTVTAEGFTYSGVNYTEIIPILVAAVQELKTRNDALQAQVSACCAGVPQQRTTMGTADSGMAIDLHTERLLIQPNPIADQTLVRYYIANEGRARLEVSAEDGRILDVLREERTTVGEHSYKWNTSTMAPGSYFVALSVDGNVIVKKVVKVGDR